MTQELPAGGAVSLEACIARVRAGDSSAFEDIVVRYDGLVLRVARRMTGNREDALDVAQESFLRIYRSLGRFRTGQKFESWVYRIVVNAAWDLLRKRHRFSLVPLEGEEESGPMDVPDAAAATPELDAQHAQLRQAIESLLPELPPKVRAVFVLRDVEGLETGEIAAILGCREVTVRRHSMEARERLRTNLNRRFPGLAPTSNS